MVQAAVQARLSLHHGWVTPFFHSPTPFFKHASRHYLWKSNKAWLSSPKTSNYPPTGLLLCAKTYKESRARGGCTHWACRGGKKQQKPRHAHRINLGSTLSSQSGLCPLLSRFEVGLTLTWLKPSPQQQFIYIFMGTSDTFAATYEKAKGVQNAECNSERQRGPAVRQAVL